MSSENECSSESPGSDQDVFKSAIRVLVLLDDLSLSCVEKLSVVSISMISLCVSYGISEEECYTSMGKNWETIRKQVKLISEILKKNKGGTK